MVWYVRLLSQPKLSLRPQSAQPIRYNRNGYQKRVLAVTCPISLATDLSDWDYPDPATLRVQVFEVRDDGWDYALAPAQDLAWKGCVSNTRVVKADLDIPILTDNGNIIREHDGAAIPVTKIVLRVTAVAGRDNHHPEIPNTLQPESIDASVDVPEFLAVWTAPYFIRSENGVHQFKMRDDLWLERRVRFMGFWEPESEAVDANASDNAGITNMGRGHSYRKQDLQPELRLWEDAGESMARHVWDGGLALATHFARILQTPSNSALSTLLHPATPFGMRLGPAPPLRILELGAGVGTSGLALANFLPGSNTHIVLTDLPDAQPILQRNIASYMQHGHTPTSTHAVVKQTQLDWHAVSVNAGEEMKRLAALIPRREDEDQEVPETENKANSSVRRKSSTHRRKGQPGKKSSPESEAQPASLALTTPASPWDLIVVSDCTYNEDTLDQLVATLAAVTGKVEDGNGNGDIVMGEGHEQDANATMDKQGAKRAKRAKGANAAKEGQGAKGEKGKDTTTAAGSVVAKSTPLIVLARKPRHSSEETFFDLMAARGFVILEQSRVRLPDPSLETAGTNEVEQWVDVFVYC